MSTAIQQLLVQAFDQYNQAIRDGDPSRASYWDGYLRGVRHCLSQQAPQE